MSQANLPGGLVVQYTYNGDGLKIRRIEGATTTRYYHDGIRPLYETKADGSRNADLERDIFGNLLARQDAGGTRYYYHHDGLGSTVGLTNASGAVAAQRTYDAWGNRRTSSGSAPGNYQFAGAELDPTSGLYHMGARFYDPTIGRWLGEDPNQDNYFDPLTLNFYAYVNNNPLLFLDPNGEAVQEFILALSGAVAALGLPELVVAVGAVALGFGIAILADRAFDSLSRKAQRREIKNRVDTVIEHLANLTGHSVAGKPPDPRKKWRDPYTLREWRNQLRERLRALAQRLGGSLDRLKEWLKELGYSDSEIAEILRTLREEGIQISEFFQ